MDNVINTIMTAVSQIKDVVGRLEPTEHKLVNVTGGTLICKGKYIYDKAMAPTQVKCVVAANGGFVGVKVESLNMKDIVFHRMQPYLEKMIRYWEAETFVEGPGVLSIHRHFRIDVYVENDDYSVEDFEEVAINVVVSNIPSSVTYSTFLGNTYRSPPDMQELRNDMATAGIVTDKDAIENPEIFKRVSLTSYVKHTICGRLIYRAKNIDGRYKIIHEKVGTTVATLTSEQITEVEEKVTSDFGYLSSLYDIHICLTCKYRVENNRIVFDIVKIAVVGNNSVPVCDLYLNEKGSVCPDTKVLLEAHAEYKKLDKNHLVNIINDDFKLVPVNLPTELPGHTAEFMQLTYRNPVKFQHLLKDIERKLASKGAENKGIKKASPFKLV